MDIVILMVANTLLDNLLVNNISSLFRLETSLTSTIKIMEGQIMSKASNVISLNVSK